MEIDLRPIPSSPSDVSRRLHSTKLGFLTRKEVECLGWCKEGKTNWEIGEILFISEKTVEFHLRNATRKLGAINRTTAVIAGIKQGFISL